MLMSIESMVAGDPGTREAGEQDMTGGRDVFVLSVEMLVPGGSPRLAGLDQAHLARLMEVETPLPPILVDRRTMRVIDGMHRLQVAVLRGRRTIEAELFDGTEAEAFLRSVRANTAHGFPLSARDRRAAAAQIIMSHPGMSDRGVAEATGLGRTTVAGIRREVASGDAATEAAPGGGSADARVGRDGRVRPLSSAEGRYKAAALIRAHPQASLREVARGAGVALATASDVRRRLERGEEPLPSRFAAAGDAGARADMGVDAAGEGMERLGRVRKEGDGEGRDNPVIRSGRQQPVGYQSAHDAQGLDPARVLEKLLRDPSLRYCTTGRHLLQVLQCNAAAFREWADLVSMVPTHCQALVGQLAGQYAQMWVEVAEGLDRMTREARRAQAEAQVEAQATAAPQPVLAEPSAFVLRQVYKAVGNQAAA